MTPLVEVNAFTLFFSTHTCYSVYNNFPFGVCVSVCKHSFSGFYKQQEKQKDTHDSVVLNHQSLNFSFSLKKKEVEIR